MSETTGKKIKTLRTSMKISQSELARILEVTRSSVNAWEMGVSLPSVQKLVELSKLFHVTTDYLLGVNNIDLLNICSLTDDQKTLLYQTLNFFDKQNMKK